MSTEVSTVRQNLMSDRTYSPYCGADRCRYVYPRTTWDNTAKQFKCRCGWMSSFPAEFISRYVEKHQLT